MLKNIDPLLNADVLHALRAMGHGDDLIICDTNFPAGSVAAETVLGELLRIDRPAAEVVASVLSVYPVDTFEDPDGAPAAGRMEVVDEPDTLLPVMEEVQAALDAADGPKLEGIERFEFYDRARQAYAVIQSHERRFYGCFALRKGVVPPEDTA